VKAWVKRDGELRLCDVPDPIAGSDELLIRVGAVSLNRGEIRTVARAAEGTIPGWDVAGTVVAAPLNRKGPGEGARVAALLRGGGWAELAAVPISQAALVPDDVGLEVAATLPIAALTVVRAFDVAGRLLGKRLLVTGGSGGVGQFAIQLGAIAGAHVCAVSTRQSEHEHLQSLGATEIVASIDDASGSFDLVLESVGGPSFARAIELVARGGVVVTIGNSSERDTTLNVRDIYSKGAARIYGLLVFEEIESGRIGARDLEQLMDLVRTGRLQAPVAVRRRWTELPETLNELERRAFAGKAVMEVE
jgi:NADPH:quinone reductase-like Zn-dependent oxidoreductase